MDREIKEITVYTNGDSANISTWSNVPYFFTETLISRNIKVNRIDLSPSPRWAALYQKTWGQIVPKIFPNTTFDYYRSFLHHFNLRYRIKKAVAAYPAADTHLFLTFSFSAAGLTQKPVVQFCDWTYKHYIKYYENRKPDFFERCAMYREKKMIKGSDIVLALFPGSAKQIREDYHAGNVSYEGNVLNALTKISEADALALKASSYKLLFVGSAKYKAGAETLIDSFKGLKTTYPELSLHIVGMTTEDFQELPPDVFCYGYLDKGDSDDKETYYSLLKTAKLFINTSPKWGAFSASIEAMYFYTPVIVTPYDEFVETFGNHIDFGIYCEQNDPGLLSKTVERILNDKNYNAISVAAHSAVKQFTWDNYINNVLDKIREL